MVWKDGREGWSLWKLLQFNNDLFQVPQGQRQGDGKKAGAQPLQGGLLGSVPGTTWSPSTMGIAPGLLACFC